jgi:hypothetical protein
LANSAFALESATKHQKHNIVSRKSESTKTDNGFIRTSTKTDETGAVASRRADVVVDKADGSHTANISGSTFEGKTYTGQSATHKTDTGYVSQGQIITPDGKVVDRSVNASVDKSTNTVTKDISVTPQGSETKTRTLVRTLKQNK